MKVARKIVAMLTMTILLCVLLASTALAAETGSMWVAVEQDEGTEALITTDTIVTDGVVKVSYNSELLTYENIEISQTHVTMYAVNAEEPGVVRISWIGKGDQELEDDAVCLIRLNFTGTGENNQIVLTGSAHGVNGSTLTFADDSDTTAPEDPTAGTEESTGDKQPESGNAATEETTDAAGADTEEPNADKDTEGSGSATDESLETQDQASSNVEQNNDPNGDDENNSSTGDTSVIWLAVAVCILSAVAIITLLLGKQRGRAHGMKMKRFWALTLALCMLLPYAVSARAEGSEQDRTPLSELVDFEKVDSEDMAADLTVLEETAASDLALEREMVDENGMVTVFIVMEGESIIEDDPDAVLDDGTQAKMDAMEDAQAEVVKAIEEDALDGVTIEVSYNYTWLVNGVAAQIPYDSMEAVRAVRGVKQVIVAPTYEIFSDASTNTISDGTMIGRENVWAGGYTGKGIKIAIIDTGLDVDHQNFAPLSEDKLTKDSATAESVAEVLGSLNASVRYEGLSIDDVYYNTKVVYGFNYSDDKELSLNITHENDEQGDHGTHVAGIAAANKVESSEVVGVAPDAQLFIMKVFGYERSGSSSDIIAALEDALILGADVVNMSLGTNAGFTSSANEFIDSIYARVAETNTVLSVSAGNNYTSGYGNMWGTNANTTTNPDNAVIGEPAVYSNVMSVASVENWKIQRNYIDVSGYQMAYVETSASYGLPSIMTLTETYGVVPVSGYGAAEDFEGLDVTGKIALVQRGVESFVDKCQNAAAAGAVACIVYNNTSGEFYMNLTDCTATIPCVSITMADGEYIIAQLEAGVDVALSFPTELVALPSVTAYEMSEFSSWGLAPDLSLEPDIAAPGGNIYSTIDNGEYGLMSGTSMAAPNISGISALVMQYVRDNFDADYRTMVQHLLISTSVPLTYGSEGLYYSPRSQGSGLANAYNAVNTHAFLSVEGVDTPKAELGDDPDRTGTYAYTFKVTNFGSSNAFYDVHTVVQSEGYTEDEAYEGVYFMSSSPIALDASTAANSDALVLTHDVDGNGAADSYDAYMVYLAATGEMEEDDWSANAFRYDLDSDDVVSTEDVQNYLNALVGLEHEGDLEDTVLCVEAGETADITVSIELGAEARDYLDTYYTNGGYVEGFTFLNARTEGTVDLSLPYLAFYGSWDEAPIIDNGNYWELLNADEDAVIGNQYWNVLFTNFGGYDSYVYPGYNVYLEDEPFNMAHIAVSPNGDGNYDTVDDIYTSLLRNAGEMTYRYSNLNTGEIYYEQTVLNVSKSIYSSSYTAIIPNVYSWYEGEISLWDWKKPDGTALDNNTQLLLEVAATGAYEGATEDIWSVPIYVDTEAPELLNAVKTTDEDGNVTLELTFRDNHYIAAVLLLNSKGTEVYFRGDVEDTEIGEDGYRTCTASFDITGLTGKLMFLISDYAMNESFYALNLGGEGSAYGDLVAYQYNFDSDIYGWVSFDADVDSDEIQIVMDDMNFVCAEYMNGFVLAQTETGALYGFRYRDMLLDSIDLETSYITQLENTYQDLAYNYSDGKLYGLFTYEDGDYPYSALYTINIGGEYVDASTEETVEAWEETWAYYRGGLYGLGLAIDDNGEFYILGIVDDKTELWVSYERTDYEDKFFKKLMSIDVATDYLQSMAWNHNTETIYWAQFNAHSMLNLEAGLYEIDVNAKTCTKKGTLSGETCALFAPLSVRAAAKQVHKNLPDMDTTVVGTPVLRSGTVTMNVGSVQKLLYDLDPWYTDHKDVIWSTSDETVAVVDQNGNVTAVGTGSAVITVANADDTSKYTACAVQVTALSLRFDGIVSSIGSGIGNTYGATTYQFVMDEGIASMVTGSTITASDELDYGLDIATSVYGRDYIWACEYGNTGMVYQIDPSTGEVVDVLQPVDGDMLFGMTYNDEFDTFNAIMNMYLYVDLELTHEETQKMLETYDESQQMFMYHRLNLLPYLLESDTGFVTGEYGQGASSEVVMCGITTLKEPYTYVDTSLDYMGNYAMGTVNYTSDQTLVILDNVGRLWYIDEIRGLTKKTVWDGYAVEYASATDPDTLLQVYANSPRNGLLELKNEDGTYNVYYIRTIEETPLTDLFRTDLMPRITYHFSDIEFAGYTSYGAPMYAISMYDYWNNGLTNQLYLYVDAVTETDEISGETVTVYEDRLYELGDTGEYNIIASIHSAEVTGGVEAIRSDTSAEPEAQVNALNIGVYTE